MTHLDPERDTERDSDRYTVPGLERGLRILLEFSRDEPTLTAPELARRLGVPRSTVFRLLVTLENMGFVERTPDGRSHRLGLAVLRLGFEYLASLGIVELGRPLLEGLRDASGYSASLVVRDAREVVYLVRSAPRSPFATTVSVGTRLPAHATVLGHVLLGDLSLAALRTLYPESRLEHFTAHTPQTVQQLFEVVQRTRGQGWVLAEGYFEPQICTVAAPVREGSGHIVAAIGLTVPGPAIADDQRERLVALVRGATAELSARLNYRDDAPAPASPATAVSAVARPDPRARR
ncbi:MAG: IclR family transcriptional regulator [Rubrivivax sp.]|nr:IclR family transcriptional regulator [Rubrivivax sp.]